MADAIQYDQVCGHASRCQERWAMSWRIRHMRLCFCWKESNIGLREWFWPQENYRTMKEYGSWVCGPWKREEAELICCKFSRCTKDYLQLCSVISSLLVRQLPTRGHTAKIAKCRCHLDIRHFFFSSRVIDRWNGLQQSVIHSNSLFQEWSRAHKRFRWASLWTNRSA